MPLVHLSVCTAHQPSFTYIVKLLNFDLIKVCYYANYCSLWTKNFNLIILQSEENVIIPKFLKENGFIQIDTPFCGRYDSLSRKNLKSRRKFKESFLNFIKLLKKMRGTSTVVTSAIMIRIMMESIKLYKDNHFNIF